jgi:2-haloacid dehalogenase
LNRRFETCTLSNANISFLEDLLKYGSLPFTHILSAEHFGVYKPSPWIDYGAASKLGLEPKDCGFVAAHLGDLQAAKGCGFQTITWIDQKRRLGQGKI